MSKGNLDKKYTALITGGTSGIGKAIVNKLIEEDFAVIVIGRNKEKLNQLKIEVKHPSNCFLYKADMTDRNGLLQTIQKIINDFGQIDLLINNAGVFIPGSIIGEEDKTYDLMMRTNIDAPYILCKHLIPIINKGGYVFNICSTASLVGYPNGASYCISKFALLGLTKVLRAELKGKIAVSAIMPGATLTKSWEGTTEPAERFMKPQDVAEVIYNAWNIRSNTVMEEIIIRPHLGDF